MWREEMAMRFHAIWNWESPAPAGAYYSVIPDGVVYDNITDDEKPPQHWDTTHYTTDPYTEIEVEGYMNMRGFNVDESF